MSPAVLSFTADKADRLDHFLASQTGESRAFVQEQIREGRVARNGVACVKSSQKLKVGDVVECRFEEKPTDITSAVEGHLEIVHEDHDLLVINKPQGLVVHPAAGHRGDTLVHYLLHHLSREIEFAELGSTRPGIVHRLDRGTSGLILVAKNRKVQEILSRMFKAREIKKEYEAVVWGKMGTQGLFRSVIGRDRKDRKKMSSRTEHGRDALTHWTRVAVFSHFTHLSLFPHTGRTHQLRVHCSEGRNPIVGDAMYGGQSPGLCKGVPEEIGAFLSEVEYPFLHARRLKFRHPTSEAEVELEAKRPARFESLLELLKRSDR